MRITLFIIVLLLFIAPAATLFASAKSDRCKVMAAESAYLVELVKNGLVPQPEPEWKGKVLAEVTSADRDRVQAEYVDKAKGKRIVLLSDDEPDKLHGIRRSLVRHNKDLACYEFFQDGQGLLRTLHILRSMGQEKIIVITDFEPGSNGISGYGMIEFIRMNFVADIKVFVVTGRKISEVDFTNPGIPTKEGVQKRGGDGIFVSLDFVNTVIPKFKDLLDGVPIPGLH